MGARFRCSVLQSFPVVPNSLQKSGLSCHPKALSEMSMPKLGTRCTQANAVCQYGSVKRHHVTHSRHPKSEGCLRWQVRFI